MADPPNGTGRPADVRLVVPLVAAIFLIVLASTYIAPIADAELHKETDYTANYSAEAKRGRATYAAEGCWYCHTQSVRPVANDLGLGGVTSAERVSKDKPALLGMTRSGPDLACIGDRQTETEALVEFLKDPNRNRGVREGARMPAYGYLSDAELADLAAYLTGLRCSSG